MDELASRVGADIYRAVGLTGERPPVGGSAAIAVRLLGKGAIYVQPRAMTEATCATIGGALRVVLRGGFSPRKANFLVARMIARVWLFEGSVGPDPTMRLEHGVAAWLVAPTPCFRVCLAQVGINVPRLADTFSITQTCATIRIPEVGGPDAAVTTPDRVYRRGRLFSWADDEDLRSLTRKETRSVRKIILRDEPGRIALLGRAS